MTEAPSDEELMQAVAEGRPEALRVLHGRHAPWVFTFAARRLGTAAAEEIVQEVFLGIFRARATFDPARGSFRGLLAEVTRRQVINEIRRRSRKGAGEAIDLDVLAVEDPGPDEAAWRAYRSEAISRALEALPEGQRRALRLAFFDDLSHEEIARTLNLPLGTTKTRIRSGLKKLGAALAVLALAAAIVWVARDQRLARGRAERALAMVTASDAERLRLEPTDVASPGAHGHYRRRPGVPLAVINLSTLDPPPAGQRYTVWAQVAGRPLRLGEATPDAAGKALLVGEDPALAEGPEAVWVTLGSATVLTWHR